jgi:hypothetical protein
MRDLHAQELIIFAAVANKIIGPLYHANVGPHETYVRPIFNEYMRAGLPIPDMIWLQNIPNETAQWIAKRLQGEFKYAVSPPEWIHEPYWLFGKDNKPMKFVAQFKEPRNEISNEGIVYVFSALEEGTLHGYTSRYLTFRLIKQEFGSETIIHLNSHLEGEVGKSASKAD